MDHSLPAPRRPRYPVPEPGTLRVEVQRRHAPQPLCGELVDLSRNGIQLAGQLPLEQGERITVVLRQADLLNEPALAAEVIWARPTDQGTMAVGCRFDAPLDWSVLGELFLNDVLLKRE